MRLPALVLLLAACRGSAVAPTPSGSPVDADQDGFPLPDDCDDADADVFPGASEFCDGLDNDCDGETDEEALGMRAFVPDGDGDGFGCAACAPVEACTGPAGFVRDATDCDDARDDVFPGQIELCNGFDDDCDTLVDLDGGDPWYADADGDGFGDPASAVTTCAPEPGRVANDLDCDDTSEFIHPDAEERCDGVDNECDGLVDDDDDVPYATIWTPDGDGDGFGDYAQYVQVCTPPPGPWVLLPNDCDDFDPTRFPGAEEICDGVDLDCDGVVDRPDAPYLPGASASVVLTVGATTASALVVEPFDVSPLLAPDPDALRLAFGSCAQGWDEIPVRFVDAWDAFGVPGVDGDGLGVLVAVWDLDGDGSTSEVVPVGGENGRLYVEGGAGPGDASATELALTGGGPTLALDGLLAAGLGDPSVFEQLGWTPRIDTPAGSLTPAGALAVIDDHPALSGVSGSVRAENGAGAVIFEVSWWRVAGRPEVWGRIAARTDAPTTVLGPTDWRTGVVLFAGAVDGLPTLDGAIWTSAGLGIRVDDAPAAAQVSASEGVFAVVGTDADGPVAPTTELPAGTLLGEVRVVLVPAADPAGRLAELETALTLDVGALSP